jgi:hypothetical protein
MNSDINAVIHDELRNQGERIIHQNIAGQYPDKASK